MNMVLSGIKNMISEDNGNPSSMRILAFLVILIVMGNWTYFNITHNTISSFDWQEISMILGVLGIKGYQKSKEEKIIKEVKKNE